jgi:proline racemase
MRFTKYFTSIDTHTGGEPTRTITSGIPPIPGATMGEKMVYMRDHLDWIRTSLMFEPRGHSVMSGVVLMPPCLPEADYGVIFIETGGYLPMCGHDTIGVSTALVEAGLVEVKEPYTEIALDTPAGLTRVKVRVEDGKARSVTLTNIPSFVFARDVTVEIPGHGAVTCDIAYGGNTYAIVAASAFGLAVRPDMASRLIEAGRTLRDVLNDTVRIQHPEIEFINEVTHVEFHDEPQNPSAHCRNAVLFGDAGIDRSPCGTGTSAKVALLHAQGRLPIGQEFVHESIIGSLFKARAVAATKVGAFDAVVPEITGSAHVMGFNQMVIDPDDPHKDGFLLV